MKTLKVDSEIDGQGLLRLEVSTGLPAGPAEVTLQVQPKAVSTAAGSARSGLFVNMSAEAIDPDAAIRELNAQWQAKLEELGP
ncbi:MAG TPA: hypothetical protein VMY42_24055 [Thermoguttaceae bacterium]|nr:hypothetical protein [Thermoguttaceae bacterium]